ncbi:hypothetical protein CBF35_12775 [Vagococcus salmoninarum]|uniref:Alternate signal-mediated exported protein n=2 Tax=Vagococcus salmoninarum TaxID=2739 RepID=A0A429ZGI0_9ENTE|nr:hypothetical protein CBF35_12775 [Vagococcus salmoninarum]
MRVAQVGDSFIRATKDSGTLGGKNMSRNKHKKIATSNVVVKFFIKHTNKLFVVLSLTLSLLLVIRGTYAWETYSDEKENKFGSVDFSVNLRESFKPNFQWEPGRSTIKEIYVSNDGQYPAFVRLKAEEFLLAFEMDIKGTDDFEGTGNVVVYPNSGPGGTIDRNDVRTWQKDKYFDKTLTNERLKGLKSTPENLSIDGKGFVYEEDKVDRNKSDLTYFDLNFVAVKDYTPGLLSSYWVYGNDGYFYYSERLKPGVSTTVFLESVTLSASAPNRLKNALYKIEIKMDASHSIIESLGEWNHVTPGDPIFELLKDEIADR